MIEVTILYPRSPGSRFDFDYYLSEHMPRATAWLGPSMQTISVERPIFAEGWPAPAYWAICRYRCESRDAFETAFFPRMEWLQADIPKYTDVQAIVQLCDVDLDWDASQPPGVAPAQIP